MESNKKKCSKCGRNDLPLTVFANISNGEKGALCPICMRGNKTRTLKEIDDELRQYEKIEKSLAEIIQSNPEMPNIPDELASFAYTPLSAYRSAQAAIAHLKTQRMELITQAGSKERLEYDLKKAVENENFVKAAEVKKQLESL